jgi:hypothetical protein
VRGLVRIIREKLPVSFRHCRTKCSRGSFLIKLFESCHCRTNEATSRIFPSQPTESVTCAPFCPPSSVPVTAAPTRSCLSPSKPSSESAGYVEIARPRPRPRPPPPLLPWPCTAATPAGEGEGDSLESSIVDFVVQCYFEYIMYRDSLGSPSSSDGAGVGGGLASRFRAAVRARQALLQREERQDAPEAAATGRGAPPGRMRSTLPSSLQRRLLLARDTKSLDLDPTPSSGRRFALGGCLHKKGACRADSSNQRSKRPSCLKIKRTVLERADAEPQNEAGVADTHSVQRERKARV